MSGVLHSDRSIETRLSTSCMGTCSTPILRTCVHRSDCIKRPLGADQATGRYDQPLAGVD